MYANIRAGSLDYGRRTAWYEVIDGVLVLLDEGDHDNLAGNHLAIDFEGYTTEQADERIRALNGKPVGHSWDGCHACKWHISMGLTEDAPHSLTSEEPDVSAVRDAIAEARGMS
jgi:hypothetical protein